MIRHFRRAVFCFTFAMLQLSISIAQSKSTAAPTAPVPMQILSAKKIFIANAGGDQMANYEPSFSGGSDRAYNQFYAAVKSWGRFEIVGSPAEADLLLEIRQNVTGGPGGAASGLIPQFRLKIRDPRTNVLLWGFNIHGQFGLGQGESDRNFDQAVSRLVMDLQMLLGRQPAAAGDNGH